MVKAAFIRGLGPPQVTQYDELPMPRTSTGDVLVKVIAVTVKPVDTYIRSGSFETHPKFPFIVGRDLVGEVVETEKDVTRFPGRTAGLGEQPGICGRQGTFSEYCLIEENLLYPLPQGRRSDKHGRGGPFSSNRRPRAPVQAVLRSGETLFVNGDDGNVGTAVLQVAKNVGAKVAVTSASEEKAKWCETLRADAVINYKTEDVTAALHRFAPNGVNIYWDVTGHPDARKALDSVTQRGRIIFMAGGGHETVLPVGTFYRRNCTLFGFTVTEANESGSLFGKIVLQP